MSDIKVSHALIVTGDNECVEALMDKGVVSDKLTKYFEAPHTHIFFRKPRCYTDDIGDRIAASATTQVGLQYDKLLILAETMQGCFLGRWVRAVFGDKPDTFVSQMLNAKDKWICSELAAYSLDSQPEYQDKGILAKPDFTIDPQELFEDNTIFCDWHKT